MASSRTWNQPGKVDGKQIIILECQKLQKFNWKIMNCTFRVKWSKIDYVHKTGEHVELDLFNFWMQKNIQEWSFTVFMMNIKQSP